MKKYIKSRKGLTLVELVVTVAILGIVSGLSLTIVVSAMNNYTEAAMMEKDQSVALLLEENIVRNARISSIVKAVDNHTNTSVHLPESSTEYGFYVAKVDDSITTFEYEKNASGVGGTKYTTLTYEGVRRLAFSVSEQKSVESPTSNDQIAFYLNYEIEMQSGYVLKGQAVMNNASVMNEANEIPMESSSAGSFMVTRTSAGFVDESSEVTVISVEEVSGTGEEQFRPNYDMAVVFE